MKQSTLFKLLLLPCLLYGQSESGLDESFDPTTLNDWGNSKARMEQIQTLREYMAIMDTEADTFELEERAPYIYRVQLASTQNLEQARTIEEHALQTFEEEVIVQFDSPFYKIRVGRMNNREDAQSLQRMAIETGYRRSWVIRTVNAPIQKDRVEEDVRTQ